MQRERARVHTSCGSWELHLIEGGEKGRRGRERRECRQMVRKRERVVDNSTIVTDFNQ